MGLRVPTSPAAPLRDRARVSSRARRCSSLRHRAALTALPLIAALVSVLGATPRPIADPTDRLGALAIGGRAMASTARSPECEATPTYAEIRPENEPFNQTPGRPTDPHKFFGPESWRPYYDKINGACTGTTEQILEWAAQKWGFDRLGYPDLAKAIGVAETWWKQGFNENRGQVGITQVNPPGWPDWEPAAWSTAYAVDYTMAVIRSHYDGNSWLGEATRGDLIDSLAAWECGCEDAGWNWYVEIVMGYLDSKPWQRAGQPPEWF